MELRLMERCLQFLLLSQVVALALAGVKFEARMLYYQNPSGQGANGLCCDSVDFFNCGILSKCDPFFIFCFDDAYSSKEMSKCPYGRYETDYYQHRNSITFGDMMNGVKNPMILSIGHWKDSIRLKVQVIDDDSHHSNHDNIDFLYHRITADPESSSETATWKTVKTTGTTKSRTALTFKYRVYWESSGDSSALGSVGTSSVIGIVVAGIVLVILGVIIYIICRVNQYRSRNRNYYHEPDSFTNTTTHVTNDNELVVQYTAIPAPLPDFHAEVGESPPSYDATVAADSIPPPPSYTEATSKDKNIPNGANVNTAAPVSTLEPEPSSLESNTPVNEQNPEQMQGSSSDLTTETLPSIRSVGVPIENPQPESMGAAFSTSPSPKGAMPQESRTHIDGACGGVGPDPIVVTEDKPDNDWIAEKENRINETKQDSLDLNLANISKMPGYSVKDVDQHQFVKAYAAFLKKSGKMKVPDWIDIVKNGRFAELAPYDEDWYYIRAASMARHLYIRAPCGVGAFTTVYGARKRNGTAPSHFCKSSGSVSRKVLQSLEGLKLVEKHPSGGRRLTSSGRRDLDRIAAQIASKSKSQPAAAAQ
ncbi:unnamed protein product [Owenia fusiformis]|uniref:Small ribosomal subunit protein eS19 n=1 Tax=Owenia fusiformis TaxID=6347 RepID=A0A8J1TWM0_OWEFU|nr:unnamed protein product [Owenia fusiformis]